MLVRNAVGSETRFVQGFGLRQLPTLQQFVASAVESQELDVTHIIMA
jgi:hypothetical protein